jgi:hypothetical protein
MSRDAHPSGWGWFEAPEAAGGTPEIKETFVSCFATASGQLVLDHLRRVFLERRLGPSASNAELRHLEGQRAVVAHILSLAANAPARPAVPTFEPHGGEP